MPISASRLIAAIPVLFGLSMIVFLIIALIPGDPATAILGSFATPENVERLNRQLGLDKPLFEQYFIWIGNVLHGDFGRSYSLNRPVLDEVLERFSATLMLAGASLVLCSIFGLLAGIVSAVRQFGWADRIITFLVLIGISIPSFWLGLILILIFAVDLRAAAGERHGGDLWRRRAARHPEAPDPARRDARRWSPPASSRD